MLINDRFWFDSSKSWIFFKPMKDKSIKNKNKNLENLLYFQEQKLYKKGMLIYTPDGYGSIQNISSEKAFTDENDNEQTLFLVKLSNKSKEFNVFEIFNKLQIKLKILIQNKILDDSIIVPVESTTKEFLELLELSLNQNYQNLSKKIKVNSVFFNGKSIVKDFKDKTIQDLNLGQNSTVFINLSNISYSMTMWEWKCTPNTSFVTEKNEKFASVKKIGPTQHNCVLSENDFDGEIHKFKLKLVKMLNNHWIYIGIAASSVSGTLTTSSYSNAKTYGWATYSQCYINGRYTNTTWKGDYKEGDELQLLLDCKNCKLTLTLLKSNESFVTDIDPNEKWKIHYNIYNQYDEIWITDYENL